MSQKGCADFCEKKFFRVAPPLFGTRSTFTPCTPFGQICIDCQVVTAQKRSALCGMHPKNTLFFTFLTKCQRIGVFSLFLSIIRHFFIAKCYLFSLFPVKMSPTLFCYECCHIATNSPDRIGRYGSAWFGLFRPCMFRTLARCALVVSELPKKNAFFLQKVCKKFAQYKIK